MGGSKSYTENSPFQRQKALSFLVIFVELANVNFA